MAVPRFTLRRLLLLVTLCAVLCLLPTLTAGELLWIVGVAFAVGAAAVLVAVQMALYAVTAFLAAVLERNRNKRATVNSP